MPANPKNANDIKDATIKAIGNPLNGFGISDSSILSLMPDIKSKAKVKPIPADIPPTKLPIKE